MTSANKALWDAKKNIAQIVADVVNLEDINYTVTDVQTLLDGITVGEHINRYSENKMIQKDVRWQQRFANYTRALAELTDAIKLSESRPLSKLEQQGLIQAFEYTHELAWKTLKDFLAERGNNEIFGSRDASREAFSLGIITQGEIWMDMIKSRNQTTHVYDESVAQQITNLIIHDYFNEFVALEQKLMQLKIA